MDERPEADYSPSARFINNVWRGLLELQQTLATADNHIPVNHSIERIVAGFLIAPGAPALVLYFINLFVVSQPEAVLLGLISAVPAYVAAVAVGVPLYFFA
jgi:hypothetical protein